MTVGIPGVGLGGIFYLLSAALMPVCELARTARHRTTRRRWSLVLRQAAIAVGVVVAIWATGWLLGFVLSRTPHGGMIHVLGTGMSTSAVHNVLRIGALALSLGSLAVVLALVQLARLVVCRADSRARQRPDSVAERSATTGPVEDRDGARLRVDSGTFGR